MALVHDFVLIKQTDIQKVLADICLLKDESFKTRTVQIHDDFILYFADSFQWIATTNPRKEPDEHLPHQSLCYHGLTLFFPNQITYFKKVIQVWYDMFNLAPDEFILTGSWTEIVGEEDSGDYEQIAVIKSEILPQLSKLIKLCEDVENDDNLCLLHLGI